MRYPILLLLILSLTVLTGCGVTSAGKNTAPTPDFVTATLPPSAVPLPTQTLAPPTPVPTIPPIEGTTTTQVNVRAETSTASKNLGTIPQFSKIQVIGRDSSTSWYQIIYTDSPTGTGWIRAEYVQVNATAEIPVIASGAGNGAGVSGLVIQKINVRSGPGTTYETLGELNPNDVVFLIGKDESGAWIQIEFANSADGKGWAALEFLQVENADALPVIGIASPTAEALENGEATPTDAPLPAMLDGDSMQSPLASLSFSALGARAAQVNGDVSSPDGDTEDWIEFKSYNGKVGFQLTCQGVGLQIELWNSGQVVDTFALACMEIRLLNVAADSVYLLRLSEINTNEIHYTKYTLILKVSQ
ncbi:MAG: SH3 domain-containing protein [Chloroflexi bacterium]|nr:SH3 domain-containing protein [Chloroflexota bacterium]